MRFQKKIFFFSSFVLFVLFALFFVSFDLILPCSPFRNNEAFVYEKRSSSLLICKQEFYNEISERLKGKDEVFLNGGVFLKRSKRHQLSLIEINGQKFVLKKYLYQNFFHWLSMVPVIRSSEGYRSWYFSNALFENNIRTPEPIFFYQRQWGPFWKEGYLLTRYEQGLNFKRYLRRYNECPTQQNFELFAQQLNELTKLTEQLDALGYIQRDFSLRNIQFSRDHLFLVDFDQMQRFRTKGYFYQKMKKKYHDEVLIHRMDHINNKFSEYFKNTI